LLDSVYDLSNIRESGALFVRKVASAIDPNMYKLLPVEDPVQIPPIEWPKEVQVSMVPNWEKMLAMYKYRAENKRSQEKEVENEETPADPHADEDEDDIDNSSSDDAKPVSGEVKRELL
jgi:hypothetical protein